MVKKNCTLCKEETRINCTENILKNKKMVICDACSTSLKENIIFLKDHKCIICKKPTDWKIHKKTQQPEARCCGILYMMGDNPTEIKAEGEGLIKQVMYNITNKLTFNMLDRLTYEENLFW